MARTYREVAIEEMLRTVEEAMSQVIDWWGDLPAPMKEAIEQFRLQLGAEIVHIHDTRENHPDGEQNPQDDCTNANWTLHNMTSFSGKTSATFKLLYWSL